MRAWIHIVGIGLLAGAPVVMQIGRNCLAAPGGKHKQPVPMTRATPKPTAVPVVHVTRTNFVMVEVHTVGMRSRSTLSVRGNTITYMSGQHNGPVEKRTATLDTKELNALIHVLEANRFPSLVGSYYQQGLKDGRSIDITLSLKSGREIKTYEVSNTGNQAPPGYYKVRDYLDALSDRKFPDQ